MNKGNKARITWISKKLESCKKKSPDSFSCLDSEIWVEVDIKFARDNIKVNLSELDKLSELASSKEIQTFHIVYAKGFGANFASNKKFIVLIEQMILDYYKAIVQHVTTWTRPAPKLSHE